MPGVAVVAECAGIKGTPCGRYILYHGRVTRFLKRPAGRHRRDSARREHAVHVCGVRNIGPQRSLVEIMARLRNVSATEIILKRLPILLLAWLAFGHAVAAGPVGEEALWSALKSGAHVVFIRHAITDAGIGDPPGFVLGDCSTQRNLSAQGRADARRIGAAFRSRRIPISDVRSSRWCRCIETAQLAFGHVTPAPMLDSMFNERDQTGGNKGRDVFASVARHVDGGNLIFVTHARNIQALTGISPSSGEMIVVTLDGPDKFKVIGRLAVPGS
jgi:phosphohistidine phosphatase SixA